ncbi:MAG: hypothetical protein MZU84_03510 [Sphingobacterium sp.]|nr:hypothetical protein [Sphingobacterium sp.]
MTVHVKQKGNFEIFESDHHHKILVLDAKDYYAWIKIAFGFLLVKAGCDHIKEKTLQIGDYFLLLPENEPNFKNNIDHLELRQNSKYKTYILPNGLPDNLNQQTKIVETEDHYTFEEIERLIS